MTVLDEQLVSHPCSCGGSLTFGNVATHTPPACEAFKRLDRGAIIEYLVDVYLSNRMQCGDNGCARPAAAALQCPFGGCSAAFARCLKHGGLTGVGEALEAHVAASHRGA